MNVNSHSLMENEMICIDEKRNDNDECIGFHVEGHASFAENGTDIVCAAVSALVINCINSIETFTEVKFTTFSDEKTGIIDFVLDEEIVPGDAKLLLLSLFHGLHGIQMEYGTKYVRLLNNQGGAKP